jgi:hypothetical protein
MTKITEMDLVRKGRLSVQRVDEQAWNAINLLTKEGGWEEMNLKPKKGSSGKAAKRTIAKSTGGRGRGTKRQKKEEDEQNEEDEEEDGDGAEELEKSVSKTTTGRKRKTLEGPDEGVLLVRRSTRAKR